MTEELEVLKVVTERLNRTDIPYMVSGSMAANYYTVPRMTRDIDIVIELKETDVGKFVDLFESDFYIDKEMIKKQVRRQGMFNLIHNQYVIKIDFIIKKSSAYQETALSRKKKVLIKSSPMWFISPEDLVISKLSWAKDSHSGMNDTHPEVAAQFRDLMKARSNEQRLLMGCSMFDTAKQIIQSAIYSQHPGITPEEMRKEIFLRFYGLEFSQAAKEKIFLMFASR